MLVNKTAFLSLDAKYFSMGSNDLFMLLTIQVFRTKVQLYTTAFYRFSNYGDITNP